MTARILVVDDEPAIRLVVATALDEATVLEAEDGPSALALLGEVPVDLVLLDVMMPAMDGFSVLDRIRGTARLTSLPVIMLTAKVGEGDHLAAFRSGADAYLTKPFDMDLLLNTIETVLASTPAERVAAREIEIGRAVLLREIETHFS